MEQLVNLFTMQAKYFEHMAQLMQAALPKVAQVAQMCAHAREQEASLTSNVADLNLRLLQEVGRGQGHLILPLLPATLLL